MTILHILNELAATNSVKAKVLILERERNNDLLKAVFKATYDPSINYYQKKIPNFSPESRAHMPLASALTILHDQLASRILTGNVAIDSLKRLLEHLDVADAEVLSRIIDRDLRCGTSDTLASRVWPGFVPTFKVMKCRGNLNHIHYPAISQLKCDGARVHAYFKDGHVTAFSSSGKEFLLHNVLDADAKKVMHDGETFDGELLVFIGNTVADRQTGNGILNKANKGTLTTEEAQMIRMVVWDIVDTSSTIHYSTRFQTLISRNLHVHASKMTLVPWVMAQDRESAEHYFQVQLDRGEEGAIIKNLDSVWVPGESNDLVKLKAIWTADLRVTGIEMGKGKYAGLLGALICETSDGLLKVKVAGFDEETVNLPLEYWNDAIVEVFYNKLTTARGRTTKSMFLPRFGQKRFDKTEADTLAVLHE